MRAVRTAAHGLYFLREREAELRAALVHHAVGSGEDELVADEGAGALAAAVETAGEAPRLGAGAVDGRALHFAVVAADDHLRGRAGVGAVVLVVLGLGVGLGAVLEDN